MLLSPRRSLLVSAAVFAALGGAGCPDVTLTGVEGEEGSPTAVLTGTPPVGVAPHRVLLDASASEPFGDREGLVFQFDVDDDGTFEREERSDEPTFEHVYALPGSYTARVRVVGDDGRFAEATVAIDVVGDEPNPDRTADLDGDANRDGVIDVVDELDEDFGEVVVIANVDDDDQDGTRDSRDHIAPAGDDLLDLTPVVLKQVRGLAGGDVVDVVVAPAAALSLVRVWQRTGDEAFVEVVDADEGSGTGVVQDPGAGDLELFIEALVPRTTEWDGRFTVTARVMNDGSVVSEDVIRFRTAPVIFPDNLQTPRQLFVMDLPSGQDNNVAFVTAMQEALPAGVELVAIDDDAFDYDRWVQDNMELGYQTRPSGDGVFEMKTAMQLQRSQGFGGYSGLERLVPEGLLGPGQGFLYPGGADSGHNYGGNLEVSPPLGAFPLGRMLYGGGTAGLLNGRSNRDTMNANQVGFLNAQEVQGPALQLSSEWLAVGHIDEIFQFVPDRSNPARPFKVIIASPQMALDTLEALAAQGGGAEVVFPTRARNFTVDEVLGASNFLATNEAAQDRIDSVAEVLKAELGLVDDDFLPVPVFYEDIGQGFVAAFNPGIQNLVTVGDRLFVPDPEGPRDGENRDIWQEATRNSLAGIDMDIIFVDVFESYHELLGEAHCGTNVDREPHALAWWTLTSEQSSEQGQ